MRRTLSDCSCGEPRDVCGVCREAYCRICNDHDEDRCARTQYEYEREEALRDLDARWGR